MCDTKKKLKSNFEKNILSRPIIYDNDFDANLCMAYINSVVDKEIEIVGIKERERNRDTFKQFGITGTGLMMKSICEWEKCSFLDFEVHGSPSIGQHLLLVNDKNIMGPNIQFKINGEKDLGHKYPMSTLIYLMYLYGDLDKDNYSEEQWKLIAIPDKTYQNSWESGVYPHPAPSICTNRVEKPDGRRGACNSRTFVENQIETIDVYGKKNTRTIKKCAKCGHLPLLKGYRKNFVWWESLMEFPFPFHKIINDKVYYDGLYKNYPHIYEKYPGMDEKGLELLNFILKKLHWKLPELPKESEYKEYYLIPEYRIVPLVERVPEDVFHHARLDIRNMFVSRKSELKHKKI